MVRVGLVSIRKIRPRGTVGGEDRQGRVGGPETLHGDGTRLREEEIRDRGA